MHATTIPSPARADPKHVHYEGRLNDRREATVTVSHGNHDGRRPAGLYSLPLRLDLRDHSPSGFAWGYAGSGPSQLALALVADALDDDPHALAVYQAVKFRMICPLPQDRNWQMTRADVLQHVAEVEARDPQLVRHAEQIREQMALDAAARAAHLQADAEERHASFYG